MTTSHTENIFTSMVRRGEHNIHPYSSKYNYLFESIGDIYDEPIPENVEGFGYLLVMNDIYDLIVKILDDIDGNYFGDRIYSLNENEYQYTSRMLSIFHHFLKSLESLFILNMTVIISRVSSYDMDYWQEFFRETIYSEFPDSRIYSFLNPSYPNEIDGGLEYFGPTVRQIERYCHRYGAFQQYTEMMLLLGLIQQSQRYEQYMYDYPSINNTLFMNYLHDEYYESLDDVFLNMPSSACEELMGRVFSLRVEWRPHEHDFRLIDNNRTPRLPSPQ